MKEKLWIVNKLKLEIHKARLEMFHQEMQCKNLTEVYFYRSSKNNVCD